MAKFKNKNGGICEVYSETNIAKLRSDKSYTEITSNKVVTEVKPTAAAEDTTELKETNKSGK